MTLLYTPATVLLGYLLGSIPIGLFVGRLAGIGDVRDYGSGKTGTTNVLRAAGLRWALAVLVLDFAKGAVPVLVGRFVFDDPWAAAIGGVAALAGHTWPVFAGFRGGRGVATVFGAFVAVSPPAALAVGLFAALVLAVSRYASLMSILGVAAGCLVLIVLVALGFTAPQYLAFAILVTVAIEFNHLENIRRLLAGTEPKIGQGGARRSSGET